VIVFGAFHGKPVEAKFNPWMLSGPVFANRGLPVFGFPSFFLSLLSKKERDRER
jgi:hypothetical protein